MKSIREAHKEVLGSLIKKINNCTEMSITKRSKKINECTEIRVQQERKEEVKEEKDADTFQS